MTFSPLRRVGAVICALMLVAAACGSDSDDAASSAPATTDATATTAAPAAAAATTAAPAAAADAAPETVASFECGADGNLQETSLLLPFPFAVPFFSVFVADSLGYFEEAGLDVSIEFTDGSAAVVQQVVAGNVDFGMSDPGPVIDATALGEDLKVPYVFQTGLIYGLVTEAGSPYTSISDFVGETVAVSEATAGEVPFFEALLASNGVDPESDVQIVETGAGATTAAAFSSDRIVAYFSDYFNLIELGFEVDLHSFDLGDFALLHAASVVATDETISEDPNLVACLSRAMARATEFTHANPTGALVAIASKHPDQVGDFSDTGFDMLALKETILRTNAYPGSSGQWGWSRPASWDHYVDLLSSRGALSAEVDSNSLYTNDFIEFANDFDKNAEHDAADALAATLAATTAAPTIAKLVTGMGQNPVSLDPQTITQVSANQLAYAIYDPLVWQLVVDGKTQIYSGLAESWDVSDDLTEYTFHLREADFHDGTPFNADAVKYMLDRISNPDIDAGLAAGALGKSYESSEVIDDRTVKVVFSEPNGGFLTSLGSPKLLIPSPTAAENLGADFALNPVGTGPFKFVEFADQQHVRLARNDNYSWGPAALGSGPVEIGEIEFRVLSDAIAQVNAVRTGEIHIAHSPPLSVQNLGGLEDDGFVVLRGATRGALFSFIFNVENVPDVRVRQALAHATDKQRLMDTVFQGQYQPATAVITQSTPGFPGYEFYPFDPDRARALLDEAGWLVGDGGKRYKGGEQLVLDWWNMTDFPVYDEMAPFLQAQYSTLLGVDVNLNSQSWPGIGDTLSEGVHDVGITSLKQPDGLSTMAVVLSCAGDARKGGFNWSFYCNEEVDAAVAAARQLPDGPEKYAATEAIVVQIMEDSPYIPMIEPQVVVVHPSDLGGFAFNGSDGTVLYHGVYSSE